MRRLRAGTRSPSEKPAGSAVPVRIAIAIRSAIAGDGTLPGRFALGERVPARSLRTAGSGVVS